MLKRVSPHRWLATVTLLALLLPSSSLPGFARPLGDAIRRPEVAAAEPVDASLLRLADTGPITGAWGSVGRQATNFRAVFATQTTFTTADVTPPAVVIDIEASSGALPGTVALSWIAPGDDGAEGTAAAYVVRYNIFPITEENWSTSTDVPNTLIPQPAGSPEGLTVSGLAPGTAYHFALKTQDEALNLAGVSNTPRATASGLPHRAILPLIMQGVTDTPPAIPDTTKVLPETTTQYLTGISSDGAVFTFSQATPALLALAPGDIMVGDVAENAPDGFLRRVISVTPAAGQVLVNTEDATLEEAIENGSVEVSRALTPEDVESGWAAQGVTLGGPAQGAEASTPAAFYLSLHDVVLYSAGGNRVKANGSIMLQPRFDWRLKIRKLKLQEASLILGGDERVDLQITSDLAYSGIKKEVVLAEYRFKTITMYVLGFPVVIRPVLSISVGVNGSVQIGLRAGVTQEARLRIGLRYTPGSFEPIREFSNSFNASLPQISGELNLRGYAGAQFTLRLYGVVGPYVRTNIYLELIAGGSSCAVPWSWWRLFGGLEVLAGIEVKVFSWKIYDYHATLFDYGLALRWVPANCSPCYPDECIPSPPPGLSCVDIPQCQGVRVVGCDPHGLACPGAGVGCSASVSCWVSNPTPSQYSSVTVYGKLRQANCLPGSGAPMNAQWLYRTVTSYCDGVAGSNGVAACTREISMATPGYPVRVVVTMTHEGQSYECSTSFTPR